MPLDKHLHAWLKQQHPAESLSLQALRTQTDLNLLKQQRENDDAHYQHCFTFPANDGHNIAVRVYEPYRLEGSSQRPALVYAHGGGWCLGSLSAWDRPCRRLAESTGCVVFSVDYRLSPEHGFPRPLNDFWQALCWIHAHAAQWQLDPACISVGGDSAGGNLAAAACLMARDNGGPEIYHQLLLYPALDATMQSASYQIFGNGYGLSKEVMAFCWSSYISPQQRPDCPLISPLHAPSTKKLPAATIVLCEYDPLRDEGEAYAKRLSAEGIAVKLSWLEGMIHGAIHMTGITPQAERCYQMARFID